jgi:hypothetical protein
LRDRLRAPRRYQEGREDRRKESVRSARAASPWSHDGGRHDETSGVTSVARHRERSLPRAPMEPLGSATAGAPRPTCSRVTTADGRSPGSRVATFHRLPGTRVPSDVLTEDSPLTVAGAAAALGGPSPLTAFPFDPRREPSAATLRREARACQQCGAPPAHRIGKRFPVLRPRHTGMRLSQSCEWLHGRHQFETRARRPT